MLKKVNFSLTRFRFKKQSVLYLAIIGLLLLMGLAKLLYSYLSREAPSTPSIQVQTVLPKAVSMRELISTIGGLTAKNEIKIRAVTAGRIERILVESGSWVKKGTLLASAIAAPEVRAPFDGYLTDWQVKPGEYFATGAELIDLVNTDLLSLTYRVPEQYAGKLDLEQPVEVTVRAFPDKKFEGVVRFISPIVDKKTHTILVRADILNPNQDLWPGMSGEVSHILAVHPNAIVIPESCLILTLEGYEAFVIKDGKIERRRLKIGERRSGRVHVISGINLTEPVVITRTNAVAEGSKAKAENWTGEW